MTLAFRTLGRLWRYDRGLLLSYVVVAAFLAVFVVGPLVAVSLSPSGSDWSRVFNTPRWRSAGLNSLLMALLSTTSSVILGTVYAFAMVKVRVPGQRFFSVVPLLLLVTPPFVSGLAFILLLGRRGLITYELLGLETSIYGWHGLWLAQTLSFFPIAYLVLRGVFMAIDTTVEQAARGLGANRWQLFRTVTLPLATPGLLAAALFIAISVLGDFGNPMLVGGRFRVLATEVYTQLTGWAAIGSSAALGLLLLVPAVAFFAAQQAVQARTRHRFVTVGSRGAGLPAPAQSAWLRWSLFAFCALLAAFVFASHGVVLLSALTRLWGVDARFTLDHLAYVLRHGHDLANSLRFAAMAAVACTLLSALAAYLVQRTPVPLRRPLDLATLLPAAVPGTLMGVAYVLSFNTPPLRLTGTEVIIVIAMAVSYLPVGYRVCSAALEQIRATLDESAANLGASRMQVFATIALPLLRHALLAAFVFCFIQSIGTLSTVIFLVGFDTPLASVTILNLAQQGSWGRASALASALMLVAFLGLGLLRALAAPALRDLGSGVSGGLARG